MWLPDKSAFVMIAKKEIEQESGCPLLFLPMLSDYHIDLGFDLHGRRSGSKSREQPASRPAAEFVCGADDKRLTRLNLIKDLLSRLHYAGKDERLIRADPRIVFTYDFSNIGQLAP